MSEPKQTGNPSTAGTSQNYFEAMRNKPPSELLVQALKDFSSTERVAIDIGAGSLRNSLYLLDNGFTVTAIDKNPSILTEATRLNSDRLTAIESVYGAHDFGVSKYNLAVASYSLPFCRPEYFARVWKNITNSLKPGAIFSGEFFGPNNYSYPNDQMTFHTEEQVREIFANDYEIISLRNWERDKIHIISGDNLHWHTIDVIARKK